MWVRISGRCGSAMLWLSKAVQRINASNQWDDDVAPAVKALKRNTVLQYCIGAPSADRKPQAASDGHQMSIQGRRTASKSAGPRAPPILPFADLVNGAIMMLTS